MGTGKILVVEDDSCLRIVMSEMLSRLGYDVSTADSGENGLEYVLKTKFDLVLSDYQMPGMDGIDLACTIKKSSPHTPVIIMTGAGREAVLSRNSMAVDEVIEKPFNLSAIDKLIRRYTDKVTHAVSDPPLVPQYCSV